MKEMKQKQLPDAATAASNLQLVAQAVDGRAEAEAVARAHRHVYLEWCGSFLSRKPWERTIREIGSHKLVFGTDGVLHNHDWELARLLSVPLADEEFRRILHDTLHGIISPLLETRDLQSIF